MSDFVIRDANRKDAERLLEIYSYYVLNTAVSCEYEVPPLAEFRDRISNTLEKYPYLVCTKDDRIGGYTYAGAYSSRAAYDWTAATSIYVDKDFRRQGIGSLLYKELERKLKELGIVNVLAGTAYIENEDEYLTQDSYRFHLSEGYTKVAHMKGIGKKFGRWYDLLWLQKRL